MTPFRYINANSGKDIFLDKNPWYLTNRNAILPAGGPTRNQNPSLVNNWTILEIKYQGTTGQTVEQFNAFMYDFGAHLKSYGMVNFKFFAADAGIAAHKLNWDQGLERNFNTILSAMKTGKSKPLFTVIVLPKRELELYALVKRVAEIKVGGANVVCCVPKSGALPIGDDTKNFNIRVNMISKINLKSGSRTAGHAWKQVPALLQGGTMVVGMDVVSTTRAQQLYR